MIENSLLHNNIIIFKKMQTLNLFVFLTLLFIIYTSASALPFKSTGQDTYIRLFQRNRRQIWGGSYNMIFARQQCEDKPCWLDDECCRGYSCYSPQPIDVSFLGERTVGICLDNFHLKTSE